MASNTQQITSSPLGIAAMEVDSDEPNTASQSVTTGNPQAGAVVRPATEATDSAVQQSSNTSGPSKTAGKQRAAVQQTQQQPPGPSTTAGQQTELAVWEDESLPAEERLAAWKDWTSERQRVWAAWDEAGCPACEVCGDKHPPPHFHDKEGFRRATKVGRQLEKQAKAQAAEPKEAEPEKAKPEAEKSATSEPAAAAKNSGKSRGSARVCRRCGKGHAGGAEQCKAPKCPKPTCALYHFPKEKCFDALARWSATGLKNPAGPRPASTTASTLGVFSKVWQALGDDDAALGLSVELFRDTVATATSGSSGARPSASTTLPSRPKRPREEKQEGGSSKSESSKKGEGSKDDSPEPESSKKKQKK